MAAKSTTLFIVLSFLLVSSTISLAWRDDEPSRRGDHERRLEQCRQQCRERSEHQHDRQQCEHECQQEYEHEKSHDRSRGDPEHKLDECKSECRQSRQGVQREWQCVQECQARYEQEKQQEKRGQQQPNPQDPQRQLEQCKHECRLRMPWSTHPRLCEQECQQRYEQQQEHVQDDGVNPRQEEEEQQEERPGHNNPYVFESESFRHRVRSEHGSVRILPNFAQRSPLLLGIANYRLAILEAEPSTFVVPTHLDADPVFYVMEGEGTITLTGHDRDRESHNIKRGDILKISAGTVFYLINRSSNQRLQIAKILRPVSIPGQVEDFFTVGGDEPESYYRVFSTELLEAALNTRRDKLERLFGQQKKGAFIKLSQEQIRSMSQSSSEHGHQPFGHGEESSRPFNLLNKRPTYSNQHGCLREIDCDDYKPLRDVNLQVSVANITSGSMTVPNYNSRATKIAVVINGQGYFEMVCPHLGRQRQQEEERPQRYQKVRGRLSRNTVFVAPPGHPIAIVAEGNENLEIVCFDVHAENNRKMLVAGKNNVVSKMEREARELAFGVPSKIVDEVFEKGQDEEMFVRGPQSSSRRESEQQQEEEEKKPHPLESILGFAGF